MCRPFQYSKSVGSEPARAARQMPIRSRGRASKSRPSDSTASKDNWLSNSSRPNRDPSRAVAKSASVTDPAAVTTRSSMAEDERAVHAAEPGVEFQDVAEAPGWPRLVQEAGRRALGGRGQTRGARIG